MVFLGSYTADGLAVADVDPSTGALTVTSTVAVPDASWLAVSGRFLYAANEHDGGSVTALDAKTLAVLGVRSTEGDGPTHLSVHPSGDFLLAANHGSGSVAVLPLSSDGLVGPACDVVRYPGGHAHQVVADPSGEWVLTVDIGHDAVHVYRLVDGRLLEHDQLAVGGGPRHVIWHPDGRHGYVVCEHEPLVVTVDWDASAGRLAVRDTHPTADRPYPGEGVVSADGRFLYVTNRGDNTIATFETAGTRLLDSVPTGGDWPRHAVLDPAEERLYVANQRSGTVTWLPRDTDSGRLSPVAGSTTVEAVAMVMFG